ncbi:MAG TPA: BMP family ABC transporter substrate-binding protein [Thermotogota bacterium]|nr:BMP family ABC transporter substrate-binding protein [Thermotogota bacterium]HRW93001.1 BMP family ABC transporter substrate-binding protein [Thermotogota bacterium]
MKKLLVIALVVLFSLSAFASIKVANLINGTLGDKSFFDSAARGMVMMEEQLGVETKVIEMGYNPSEWEPTLDEVSDMGIYDIIIVGTWQMVDILARIAPLYPDTKYLIYDTEMDFSTGELDNVYAITYKQNEGSFLAGALAALVSKSADVPNTVPDKRIIGLLGGMDIPVINDFLIGYIEGAQYITPGIKVALSYVGAWNDPAKGKEFTLAMYRQGADVVFAVAGETGNGVLEAAKEFSRWSIGVDSDMQLIYESKDMDIVNHTLTSMLKNVDYSLFLTVQQYLDGELAFGQNVSLGLKEGAVGLAQNKYFDAFLSQHPDIQGTLAYLEEQIVAENIEVTSAMGMSNEELDAIRNAVKP